MPIETTSVLTPPGVASFINLQKPRAFTEGQEPRYSLNLIFDKAAQATPEFKKLQEEVEKATTRLWPGKRPPNLHSPFRDGADKEDQYDGYKAGYWYINPWTKERPGVIDARKNEIIDFSEIWPGWIARATVRPVAFDRASKRGVLLLLDAVQFIKPGPKRLDGRRPAAQSFPDDLSIDDDERV